MHAISRPVPSLSGTVIAPGDKSCSHRAVMFAALAPGKSRINGLLESGDITATIEAMRAMGAHIGRQEKGIWDVDGSGGLRSPTHPLDMGNAGTAARLIAGLIAGQALSAHLTGDQSLSRRPMERVLAPLRRMGASCTSTDGHLPIHVSARHLRGIDHVSEQASAQVKSALLLAGLGADGTTSVSEATRTRTHSETMLSAFGATLTNTQTDDGYRVTIAGGQTLRPTDIRIAGDPSSAAFLWASGLIVPDGAVVVEKMMDHPDRTGLVGAARAMGADLSLDAPENVGGEKITRLCARSSRLEAVSPDSRTIAAMIDEFPLFGVLAAYAHGDSHVSGADELRHKESDRITATVAMLRANGVAVDEHRDGFVVHGCGGPPPGGGLVTAHGDHRIAMSALILGCGSLAPVAVDDASSIATSYPDFFSDMAALGADIASGTTP